MACQYLQPGEVCLTQFPAKCSSLVHMHIWFSAIIGTYPEPIIHWIFFFAGLFGQLTMLSTNSSQCNINGKTFLASSNMGLCSTCNSHFSTLLYSPLHLHLCLNFLFCLRLHFYLHLHFYLYLQYHLFIALFV